MVALFPEVLPTAAPRAVKPIAPLSNFALCSKSLRLGLKFFAALGRYHRLESSGWERIPQGPCIFVGNHNGGLYPIDGLFAAAYYQRFGTGDPIYILTHDILSRSRRIAPILQRVGMVQASKQTARALLAAGHKIMVFPGGDLDCLRPFSKRRKIELGERKGFAQLAIEQQIPLVPIVAAGAHETMVVLHQGQRLAKLLGIKRYFRVNCFPTVLCVPWGLTIGPGCALPYLPLPAKVSIEIGAPVYPQSAQATDAASLRDTVHLQMQGMLTALYAQRRRWLWG